MKRDGQTCVSPVNLWSSVGFACMVEQERNKEADVSRQRMLFALLVLLLAGSALTVHGVEIACTTTIVGDVVSQIVGDSADVWVLLPTDADPHAFEPRPQDVVALEHADLIFTNGVDLEAGMANILEAVTTPIVPLSDGLTGLLPADDHDKDENGEDDAHEHEGVDPHVWFDPMLVAQWIDVIVDVVGHLVPSAVSSLADRGDAYRRELETLDAWIFASVAAIPEERRHLVSDHRVLAYYAHRYGFTLAGAVIPGISSLAEPSARGLAELIAAIEQLDVPAIFVGTTANPALAEQVAADTGTHVVVLYTGSLSNRDGPAGTYLDFMRYTTTAIVEALGEVD